MNDKKSQRPQKPEPTLKELMAQRNLLTQNGKISEQKEPSIKSKIEKAQQPSSEPKPTKWQSTREDRIKTMINSDPEKAAELLRKVFLDKNNKK